MAQVGEKGEFGLEVLRLFGTRQQDGSVALACFAVLPEGCDPEEYREAVASWLRAFPSITGFVPEFRAGRFYSIPVDPVSDEVCHQGKLVSQRLCLAWLP